MPATNYLDQVLMQSVLGAVPYNAPGTLYVSLSSTIPVQNGTNFTEPTDSTYARVGVANNTTNWVTPATLPSQGYQLQNASSIAFNQVGTNWGTILSVGLFDASTGGHLLYYTNLSVRAILTKNAIMKFKPGALLFGNT